LIENVAKRNETADPAIIILRLKEEIAQLKAEIQMLKGGEVQKDHLAPEEISTCNDAVEKFIKSMDPTENIIMNS
jgi:kinesin family member 6/9